MHTFSAMAADLNRTPFYLSGLQRRFDLPAKCQSSLFKLARAAIPAFEPR
jgi:hypothetical protein